MSDDRFTRPPAYLAERSRTVRMADVPVLLAHPDWERPAPVTIWLHGRTAHKELDSGRYLRWIRAGIAACAIDLPWHGERRNRAMQGPDRTMHLLQQAVDEIDPVVEELGRSYGDWFDGARLGLGGMSAGGMAVLRRLCDDHAFRCAAVEATTGSFAHMPGYAQRHEAGLLEQLDPMRHVDGWRPIPLLAAHSEADEIVPIAGMRAFVEALRQRYERAGADDAMVRLETWARTGAPYEHLGFGRHSNDAKNLQTAFLTEHLL